MIIGFNKTVLTKKEIVKQQNIALLKSSWLVLIFAVVLILLAFRVRNGQFVLDSIFFIVVGALTLPFYFILVKIIMYKQNKKLPHETSFSYIFTDSDIQVTISAESKEEKFTLNLNMIKKVKFEKKYIVIYFDKNALFFVNKKGFENEQDMSKIVKLLNLRYAENNKKIK